MGRAPADTCKRSIAFSGSRSDANRRRAGLGHKKCSNQGCLAAMQVIESLSKKVISVFYPLSVCSARKFGLSELERGLQAGAARGLQ